MKRAGGEVDRPMRRGFVLPDGWLDCPQHAINFRAFEPLRVIPAKVPLGSQYDKLLEGVPWERRWSPMQMIDSMFAEQKVQIGLILDLTNSNRYYNIEHDISPEAHQFFGVQHVQVPCRGRGQSPEPAAVNQAIWVIWRFMNDPARQHQHMLIHCTHGFNRSGYIIVNALMRLVDPKLGLGSVYRAIRRFAEARPPGIYKDGYINDLFAYHHERRDPLKTMTPAVPDWKGVDPEDAADEVNETLGGLAAFSTNALPASTAVHGARLSHDNVFEIGEPIPPDETEHIQRLVYMAITGEEPRRDEKGIRFPGSQPVSLDRKNLAKVGNNRYMVTWKADGTRYMMYVEQRGVYVIDRSNRIARVQMRFPTMAPKAAGMAPYPVGPQHRATLLDGEMVVDEDASTGLKTRRFLIYDMCVVDQKNLVKEPWKHRWVSVLDLVITPRKLEADYIGLATPHEKAGYTFHGRVYAGAPYPYDYAGEPFKVRRKDFFFLNDVPKVLANFQASIIGHETDGLILQGYMDPYIMGTCHELLKWKYASMNSVDFVLKLDVDARGQLRNGDKSMTLMLMKGGGRGATYLEPLRGHRVIFPQEESPLAYKDCVIECALVEGTSNVWRFMRERKDKQTANAWRVYESVVRSIQDGIHEQEIIYTLLDMFLRSPVYEPDRQKLPPAKLQQVEKEREARKPTADQIAGPPPPQHVADPFSSDHAFSVAGPHGLSNGELPDWGDGLGPMSPYRPGPDGVPVPPEYVPGGANDYVSPPSPFRLPLSGHLEEPLYIPGGYNDYPARPKQDVNGSSAGAASAATAAGDISNGSTAAAATSGSGRQIEGGSAAQAADRHHQSGDVKAIREPALRSGSARGAGQKRKLPQRGREGRQASGGQGFEGRGHAGVQVEVGGGGAAAQGSGMQGDSFYTGVGWGALPMTYQ